METRHLIDGIVRQTTVLVAQLSTVAGIRAPLARVADQVFLNLARELEAQGVARKVAADMFGLALRSYQVKINRLTASATTNEQTVWEAVIEHLRATGGCRRSELMERFRRDDPGDVAAVLKDLVDSGLVSRTGRTEQAFYQLASTEAVAAIAERQSLEAVGNMVWLAIYDHQEVERAQLLAGLPYDRELASRAVDALLADGRVALQLRDGRELLVCRKLAIALGSEQGWEAAVFDHFRAVANAIAAKLQRRGPNARRGDLVGGSTVTFSLRAGHPFETEVYGLLDRMRAETSALWDRVSAHNTQQPIDPAERIELTFYFGQSLIEPEERRREDD